MKPVPFQNWKEWKHVYSLLFKSIAAYTYDQFNAQFMLSPSTKEAEKIMTLWTLKGKAPLLVSVTLEMVSTLLAIEQNADVKYKMSLCIARAISQIADHFRISRKKSIISICEEVGISPLLIDIRHTISHREIPEKGTLILCARMLLFWCFKKYWIVQSIKITKERQLMRECLLCIQSHSDSLIIENKGAELASSSLYELGEQVMKGLSNDIKCEYDEDEYEKSLEIYIEKNEKVSMKHLMKNGVKVSHSGWYSALIRQFGKIPNGIAYLVCPAIKMMVHKILSGVVSRECGGIVNIGIAIWWVHKRVKDNKYANSEMLNYHLRMLYSLNEINPMCRSLLKLFGKQLYTKIARMAASVYESNIKI
jgi:Las1-like